MVIKNKTKKSAAELKKEMEILKKKQQEQEEDSDEMDEMDEEDDDIEEEDNEEEEEEQESGDDGNVDAQFEESEQDEEDEDEEDEDGEKIPKLKPNAKKAEDEEDQEEEAEKEKEELMMNKKGGQPDQAILNMKINDILHVLAKFKENNKEDRSRQSYLEELTDYLMQYYSYNRDLIQLFMTMFNPNELVSFLEANEAQRPVTIRTNTLKTRRKELAQILIQRGVNLDTLAEWTKVGLKIYDTKVPIGATPEYLAGHYMLQSASSFLPVIALAPQQNEKILDMAAAPGGKTTYIAQLMKNTGVLFANDVKADRNKALIFNVQRMGINNCIVTNFDGRKLTKIVTNCDRVLLDAPCTGLGIIARDPSVKANKQLIDVQKHAHLQRELILAAIDCCKKGGYIVYSTCSVSVQENESVVDFALKNRFVKLVDMGIEVGEEGYTKYQDKRFDPQLKKTRRILPHIHNMDGFYVAKLKKLETGSRTNKNEVENVNLDVTKHADSEEQKQLEKLKNSKVHLKQGTQGVVEVTANGEDFDWDEEEMNKFEDITAKKQVLQKSILDQKEEKKRGELKSLKEKKLAKNQKKDHADIKDGEGKEKTDSKKDLKIAAKKAEKKIITEAVKETVEEPKEDETAHKDKSTNGNNEKKNKKAHLKNKAEKQSKQETETKSELIEKIEQTPAVTSTKVPKNDKKNKEAKQQKPHKQEKEETDDNSSKVEQETKKVAKQDSLNGKRKGEGKKEQNNNIQKKKVKTQ